MAEIPVNTGPSDPKPPDFSEINHTSLQDRDPEHLGADGAEALEGVLPWVEQHKDMTARQAEQPESPILSSSQLLRVHRIQANQLRAAKERSMYDPMTGLKNKQAFNSDLQQVISRDRRSERPADVAIELIDLDRFKWVNDTFGHDFGDALVKVAADTIKASTRAGDDAYKWGGDEFARLYRRLRAGAGDSKAEEVLASRSQELQAAIKSAFREAVEKRIATYPPQVSVDQADIDRLGATIAYAIMGPEEHDDEALFRKADEKLKAAKKEGRGENER